MKESGFDISLRIYFIIAFGHLMALFFGPDYNWAVMITKPMLVPVLFVAFFQVMKNVLSTAKYFVLLALFFSWIGDVVLMFQDQDTIFFIIGLIAFLLAHNFYIVAFYQEIRNEKTWLLRSKPWLALILIGYAVFIFMLMKNNLDSLLIPVIIYECVITLMAMMALNRYTFANNKSFQEVFSGALFFLLSDSLLAINKFVQPFPLASFFIMFTYILAQLLIVKGMVDQYVMVKDPEVVDE